MQSKVVKTLALVLLLGAAAVVPGQQPTKKIHVDDEDAPRAKQQAKKAHVEEEEEGPRAKQKAPPAKSKLEAMLTEALKNNPDIRVDAAKLAEAEAKLNRTRVQVTQKVVTLHQAILSQKAVIEVAQKKYDRVKRLNASAAVDAQAVEQAMAELTIAKAKLEELEAQIPALLGKVQKSAMAEVPLQFRHSLEYESDGRSDIFQFTESSSPQNSQSSQPKGYIFERAIVSLPQAEKLRKALQTPVKVKFEDATFDDILNYLSKMVEGLSFRNLFARKGGGNFELPKLSLQFEEALPVSAILQALEDETGCRFFVREYGIVATTKNGAPLGAITVEEFLRQKPSDDSRRRSGEGKNPPAEDVEGLVKSVDVSGLMTISIGSDAGLAKGHTLELFRLNPSSPSQSKYLGTVRILETQASQSVAQPVGGLSGPPQRGDRVASRLWGGKNPPAENVQGLVKSIDAGGSFTISIGSDAGLAKGQTLELYWQPHKPPIEDARPFGTVRIVEVEAHQAVVQPVGRLSHNPQQGDRFIGRIQKK